MDAHRPYSAADDFNNAGGLVAQGHADPDGHPQGAGEDDGVQGCLRGGLIARDLAEVGDAWLAVA